LPRSAATCWKIGNSARDGRPAQRVQARLEGLHAAGEDRGRLLVEGSQCRWGAGQVALGLGEVEGGRLLGRPGLLLARLGEPDDDDGDERQSGENGDQATHPGVRMAKTAGFAVRLSRTRKLARAP
jgi:hypothetical protein